MKKHIIITSIFEPNEVIKAYAGFEGYQLIVVGDKKSPPDWKLDGVTYLSPDDQQKLNFKILKQLPWNHYCRKMVGYLYAISQGTELIIDTDDDNFPLNTWGELAFEDEFNHSEPLKGFVNIYSYFSQEFIWPRGLPLKNILKPNNLGQLEKRVGKVGVWQFLANGDPDVDAIYRLVINKRLNFEDREPIVLAQGTISPFNSQNTVFSKQAFPLLYLPSFVTFRFTDILRGLVAQPILWQAGLGLGIGPATVRQERNQHDYLKDFESEIPVFLNAEDVIKVTSQNIQKDKTILENLKFAYAALEQAKIVTANELNLLAAWQEDLHGLDF